MPHKYQLNTTVSSYIDAKNIKKIKQSLLSILEEEHDHKNIEKAFTKKKLFPQIENYEMHSKYASFLGGWSEHFIHALKKNGVDCSDFLTNAEDKNFKDFLNSPNSTELSIAESIQTYKEQTEDPTQKPNDAKESNQPKLLNVHLDFFKNIVVHFRDQVFPHTDHFLRHSDFINSSKCKNIHECNILGWAFDFYDTKNDMIVDFKFHQHEFSTTWAWQLLLYVYVLDFYYNIQAKGIKIINTFFGLEYSATLVELFGEQGVAEFFKICRLEIPDTEKCEFQEKTKFCYKWFLSHKTITHDIIKKIYLITEEALINKTKEFIEDLFNNQDDVSEPSKQEESQNIETKLKNSSWLWKKWIEWGEKGAQKDLIDTEPKSAQSPD